MPNVTNYVLRLSVIHEVPAIELTSTEFTSLRTARAVLVEAFAIEEKYEIVVANFLDLEKQLLDVLLTSTVRRAIDYDDVFAVRSALNIRLVNLLTATKLYLDQLPQHVADCAPDAPDLEHEVDRYCSNEYDNNFEYRFMEALRNHVQHRGIPIHMVRPAGHWTTTDDSAQMEFSISIEAQRQMLESDEKFKRSVLSEMTADVNLLHAARKYVQSISSIHQFVREQVSTSVTAARTLIEGTHKRYSETYQGNTVGLSALEMEGDQVRTNIPLLLNWDDVRIQLQKRNPQLLNLARTYVTNKIPP